MIKKELFNNFELDYKNSFMKEFGTDESFGMKKDYLANPLIESVNPNIQ